MPFTSLRRHALMASASLAVAVIVPLGAGTALAPSAQATTAPSVSAPAAASGPTAAQVAAAKKKTAAAAAAAKKKAAAASAAAKKRAAAAAKKAHAKRVAAKKAARKAAKKRAAHRKKARQIARGKKVVKIAARYKGRPYRWGASGPSAFDCSGFTKFVARKAVGVSLPHYTVAQRHHGAVKRVAQKNRRVGDLIFFHRRGTIPHVAIYAGKGKMWDAPHSGSHVKKHKVHSGKKSYGRIA